MGTSGMVFSDVEGTLTRGSLPALSVEVGLEIGIFALGQARQLRALLWAAAHGPATVQRSLLFIAALRAAAGIDEAAVERWVAAIMPRVLPRVKPGSLARLRAHQAAGLPLVLASGGMHPLIARLAQELGGHGEGTKLQLHNGVYTAKIAGMVCQGEGKAERTRQLMAQAGCDPRDCYGYGDTASDIPFLALFGHPHAVDPDAILAAEAHRRGWQIVRGDL